MSANLATTHLSTQLLYQQMATEHVHLSQTSIRHGRSLSGAFPDPMASIVSAVEGRQTAAPSVLSKAQYL